MRKLASALMFGLSVACGHTASAADLAQPYNRGLGYFSPAPVSTWAGLYVGVTAGYTQAEKVKGDVFVLDLLGLNPEMRGPFLGATVGYNFQIDSTVVGAEADVSFASIRQTKGVAGTFLVTGADPAVNGLYTGTATIKSQVDTLSTFRAKVGYAIGPSLLYLTGGLAIATVKARITGALVGPAAALGGTLSDSKTTFGGTLGAGFEYAFNRNWSLKAEYLRVWIPEQTYFAGNPLFAARLYTGINVFRGGVNYRF